MQNYYKKYFGPFESFCASQAVYGGSYNSIKNNPRKHIFYEMKLVLVSNNLLRNYRVFGLFCNSQLKFRV
jgi:hypothetical protein